MIGTLANIASHYSLTPSVRNTWDPAVQSTTPYGWWKFDETTGTVVNDSSGNNKHGTWQGGGTYALRGQDSLIPGKPEGKSFLWNSPSVPVVVGGLSYDYTNHTKAIAYRYVGGSTSGTIWYDGINNGLILGATSALAKVNWSEYTLVLPGTATPWNPTSYGLYDGTAHLLVMRVSATKAEVFLDGVLRAEATYSQNSGNVTEIRPCQTSSGSRYDEMILWTRQLTNAEIARLWGGWKAFTDDYAPLILSRSTLLGWWRVNETTAHQVTDYSGFNRHGSYVAGGIYPPTLGVPGLLNASDDTAAYFDGVENGGEINSASWMDVTAFSVEAWVKPDPFTTGNRVIAARHSSGAAHWIVGLGPTGRLGFWLYNSGFVYHDSGVDLAANETAHVVATFGAGRAKIYVDGVGVYDAAATVSRYNSPAFKIGFEHLGISFFKGVLDEIAYYGSALTATEVLENYEAGAAA